MGTIHARVRITNPADARKYWEGLFQVGTGVTDTLVPRPYLESIGLKPRSTRVYTLADGSEISVDITVATLEVMGEKVGGTVIFGEPGAEPQLGTTALLSAGVEVDPVNQCLKKLPSVRLKTVA
ncbi:MAG: clan AA aspartic protease [Gemmatimonadetes bacterium]|nr:clan AA aspartic protease [Gemmatimonadota bacterium]MYI98313.1 clan AA aspartic protease [Gemmatimonadota bacterium]